MATVFIFHGIGGHSAENWFPWMKKELEATGHRCIVPNFPNPDHPVLDEWLEYFKRYAESVDRETVFIGHSLGATLALRLLERMRTPIHSCFLVAPVWEVMGNEFDPLMSTFNTAAYDWNAVNKSCAIFTVLQSDNDPYITEEKSQALANHLKTSVTMVHGAGHFNESAGYKVFPLLRDLITS